MKRIVPSFILIGILCFSLRAAEGKDASVKYIR